MEFFEDGRLVLYNLRDDFSEKHDLSASEPARLAELTAKLKQIHAEVKAESPTWPLGPGLDKRD